jgi:hypothetical protein
MKTIKRLSVLTISGAAIFGATLAITTPAYAAGTSAISGATVFSDSTVHAAPKQPSPARAPGQSVKQIAAGSQDC